MPPALRLFVQRRFAPLFVLFQTGTFNDNAIKNILIWLITFGGISFLAGLDSDVRVPVAAFVFTGPFLLVCAIAGQLADKFDRGVIFRWVKRAELLIVALAIYGLLAGHTLLLIFSLGMMGAQSAFFSPTKNAVLPQWLTERELIAGNGLLSGFGFVFILVGGVGALAIMAAEGGRTVLAVLMAALAVVGWIASEFLPPAPAPKPDLKVDYNPLTATWSALKDALESPDVLRPMLGISWFYALSTVFVTTLPNYVQQVMGYDTGVLIVSMLAATLGILVGSLICALLGNLRIWGPEAVRLSTLGIIGTTLFSLAIYLGAPDESVALADGSLRSLDHYMARSDTVFMLVALFLSSVCSGLFVVPLQAMQQRRADPAIRARLMSAGAVLLNLAVNIATVILILIASRSFAPKVPFLIIIFGSLPVIAYSIWRSFNPTAYTAVRAAE